MAITISVVNEKGGCGKTTTAYSLAQGLRIRGYKVLGIDMDSQGNFSTTWGSDPECIGIVDVLMRNEDPLEAIQKKDKRFDLISGDKLLRYFAAKTGYEVNFVLDAAVSQLEDKYDVIVIDTPPTVATLTTNALMASNYVLIPATPESYSVDGLVQLHESIRAIQRRGNQKNLKILGILITRFRKGTRLATDMTGIIRAVADKIGTYVFESRIRENMAIKEAQTAKKSIFEYDRHANGYYDYNRFIDEAVKEILKDYPDFKPTGEPINGLIFDDEEVKN